MSASIKLLRHQGAMLNTVASIVLNSLKPRKGDIKEVRLKSNINNIIPNTKIVNEYHKWLGATERYPNAIAPHLFPLWSYPDLFKLGEELNLPLHKVLNQGVKLIINDKLPQNSPLNTKIEILDVKNFDKKYRINQRITTSSRLDPEALVAEIYAVILKDTKSALGKSKVTKVFDTSKLSLISSLVVSKQDAQSYAYLSGDVNPIHLSKNIAKLMGLKGSIMHGFGLFAILFENLSNAGFDIKEIDVRFLNPVYLGSTIEIFVGKMTEEKYSIRVFSSDHKTVHLSGDFKIEQKTLH
jgi:acyl dehydratase